MEFLIVEPFPLPILIPVGPKYSPQDCALSLHFISSWIEFWFVSKEPKYLKVFTFSWELLPILICAFAIMPRWRLFPCTSFSLCLLLNQCFYWTGQLNFVLKLKYKGCHYGKIYSFQILKKVYLVPYPVNFKIYTFPLNPNKERSLMWLENKYFYLIIENYLYVWDLNIQTWE